MQTATSGELKKSFGPVFWIGILVSIFLMLSFSYGEAEAAVTGTVSLDGKKSKAKRIKMNADPACGKQHKKKGPRNPLVKVGKKKKLPNTIVFINGVTGGTAKSGAKELDQKGCLYKPLVIGITTGETLTVKNSDPTLHNVRYASASNESFNKAMAKSAPPITRTFKKPEEKSIQFKCDVHPWMSAHVFVRPDGYFDVTTKKGAFSIDGVPDGTYELVAQHPVYGKSSQQITVKGGKTEAALDVKIKK